MKKFIMCVVTMFMCSSLNAGVDYKYQYQYQYQYQSPCPFGSDCKTCNPLKRKTAKKQGPTKSFEKIIKEILNRRKNERKLDKNKTIPIPLYDSIKPNLLKDLA